MNSKRQYFFIYTIVFTGIMGSILYWYFANGKIPVRFVDGVEQIYISFVYIGRWIRTIARNVLVRHQFSIPMWDPALGYGQDVINTIAGMVGDPLNWFSAVIPSRYAEGGFIAILILRCYLSGVTFSIYSFYKKNSYVATLIGTLIYTFSASIFIGFVQQVMITSFYIFPIVMLGVCKIWDHKKPYLYIAALALSFFTFYYFAYMMCVLVVGYCLLRAVLQGNKMHLPEIGRLIAKFLVYSVCGIGIAAIALVPMAYILSKQDRLTINYTIGLLYNKNFNGEVITGLITQNWMGGRDCIIGFAPIVLVISALSLTSWKKNIQIRIEFVILSCGLLLPYFGHVLNGFSYPANRWVWGYCLVVGLLCADVVDHVSEYSKLQLEICTILCAIYIAICRVYFGRKDLGFLVAIILIILGLLCVMLHRSGKIKMKGSMVALTCICCLWTGVIYNSPLFTTHVADSADGRKLLSQVLKSGGQEIIRKSDFQNGTRYDENGIGRVRNATWLKGVSGIEFYMNICNPYITSFNKHMGLLTAPFIGGYSGLNQRSQLEAMMGVNQYLIPEGQKYLLPYGYSVLKKSSKKASTVEVYAPETYHNIAFTYDDTVSWDEYLKLTPYQRQQLIMHACVIEDGETAYSQKNVKPEDNSVAFQVSAGDGVSIDGKKVTVTQPGAKITLQFKPQRNVETYIQFLKLRMDDRHGESFFSITAEGLNGGRVIEGTQKAINGLTPNVHMYGGKEDWLINLGYHTEEIDQITITFNNSGIYYVGDLSLYATPSKQLKETIEGTCDKQIRNVLVKENTYHIEVNLTSDKIVFASIPYSEGWRVYVDGKKSDLMRANDGFMAVSVREGKHVIEYHYTTPGLKTGAVFSLLFTLSMIVFYCMDRKRNWV